MRLDQIEAFVRCAETGSISAAARSEKTPKSTLSRLIAELELELRAKLLDRSARGVVLTDEGLLFLDRGRLVLDAAQNAAGAFLPVGHGLSGVVRVTAPYTFGITYIAPHLSAFFETHPDIDVHLELSSRNAGLVEEGFDLAVRVGQPADMMSKRLMANPLKLAATPLYLRRTGSPRGPSDLESRRLLVIGRPRARAALRLSNGDESYAVRVAPRLVSSDPAIVLRATLDATGIGEIPWIIAKREFETGALVEVLPTWSLSGKDVYLVSPPARATIPRVRAFAEFVVRRLAG